MLYNKTLAIDEFIDFFSDYFPFCYHINKHLGKSLSIDPRYENMKFINLRNSLVHKLKIRKSFLPKDNFLAPSLKLTQSEREELHNLIEKYGINKTIKSILQIKSKDFLKVIHKLEYDYKFNNLSQLLLENKNILFDKKFSDQRTDYSKLSPMELLEIICLRFFDDIPNNVRVNLLNFEEFVGNYKEHLTPKQLARFDTLLPLQKYLTNKDGISYKDFCHVYKMLRKTNNIPSLMYDCTSIQKRTVAKSIAKSLTPVTSLPKLKQQKVPNNVEIYSLKGKSFRLLIQTTSQPRNSSCSIKEIINGIKQVKSTHDVNSMSYISDSSMVTYRDLKKYLTFCYFAVRSKDILYATEEDNFQIYQLGDDGITNYKHTALTSC